MHIVKISLWLGILLIGCVKEQPYTTTPQPRANMATTSTPVPSSPGYYPADGPTEEPEKKKKGAYEYDATQGETDGATW